MDDDTSELDNPGLVGTPQAGDDAGDEPTSGNDDNAETQVEDPTESDELDDDPDDDRQLVSHLYPFMCQIDHRVSLLTPASPFLE